MPRRDAAVVLGVLVVIVAVIVLLFLGPPLPSVLPLPNNAV